MRRLEVWVPVEGKPEHLVEALQQHPSSWLPGPADDRGPGHYRVDVTAGPLERTVTVAIGEAQGDDRNLVRRLLWVADAEVAEMDGDSFRALPRFEGVLELVADGDRRASLRVEGGYEPPEGPIGSSMSPEQVGVLAETIARFVLDGICDNVVED